MDGVLDRLRNQQETILPKFTIVLMQPEKGSFMKEKINKIESLLRREVNIISFDEMKAEMDL